MKLDLQYDLVNYTPASASPVDANFDRVEQHVNQELVERDGTVAMRAQLKLVGDPVADLDAAPKQYVDQFLPIGIVMMYGAAVAPLGGRWLLCNGAELESALYPALFAIIGQSYSPDGTPAGRFHLPNLTDRFPIGAGTVGVLGKSGGSKDAIVPSHAHSIDHGHAQGQTSGNSVGHKHLGANHGHLINSATGPESAAHDHWLRGTADSSAAGGLGEGNIADGLNTGFNGFARSLANNSGHTHPINVTTDGADRDLTTDWNDANHVHVFTAPAMAGSSGTTGVAATNANLPPYVGIAFIMRVV